MLNPLMLAWLAGAAVPLLLHLLSRSQYRAVEWGAMMFLTGTHSTANYSGRIRQWILLLLRMGMIGLLAVALARPVISARHTLVPTGGLTTGRPAAVVIILDDSASMGYTRGGKSRLDQAREVTLQILSALKRGDQAALLLAGPSENPATAPPGPDLQSIAAKVADLQPDTGEADFARDIERAADLLQHAKPADHEIFVICDRQAISWRGVNAAFKQRWSGRRSAGNAPRVTVFPVGGDEADNLAVEGIDFPDRVVIREQPTEMQIRIHNYGPTACDAVPVSVWNGNKTIGEFKLAVPPHTTKVQSLTVRLAAGSPVISAALQSTGLTSDDRLDCAVDVLEPLNVLLVTDSPPATSPATQPLGEPSGEPVGAPASEPADLPLIKTALTPLASAGRKGVDPAVVTVIGSGEVTAGHLRKCNVVILEDVARLAPKQIALLEAFVARGGGILIAPGDRASRGLKNNRLYQSPLLPAVLKAPVAFGNVRPAVSILDRTSPVFRPVLNRPDPFATVRFFRRFPATVRTKDAHILARFANGDPLLIQLNSGPGRILLLTSALDPGWNELSKSKLLQPLLLGMVRSLGIGSVVDRNLSPGQPIVAIEEDAIDAGPVTVQLSSGGRRDPAVVTRANDHTELRYLDTTQPGTYRLRYRVNGREKSSSYVVRAGHADADLTPMTATDWQACADRIGFTRVDLARMTVADAIEIQRGGRELWIDLLGGVLLLMLLEMILSRAWSGG
jgi:hypothetical protein